MVQPANQNEVTIGDMRVVYLPDGYGKVDKQAMFPTSNPEAWKLHEEWLDEEGRVVASIGGFLIQVAGRNIVIDTGYGDRAVDFPGFGPFMGGRFMESLKGAGVAPEDIDTVTYTHLHLDHVGWTSLETNGQRGLTFPNARHLFTATEWDFWDGPDQPLGPSLLEVRDPLQNHTDFIRDGQEIAPGVNVIATPGHTPGHVSFVLSSGTARLIILGDVMHCPLQFDEADWSVVFDVDPEQANRTRERMMAELEGSNALAADGHFPNMVFGRMMSGQGKRQWVVMK